MTAAYVQPAPAKSAVKLKTESVAVATETTKAVPVVMKRQHEAWDVFQEF